MNILIIVVIVCNYGIGFENKLLYWFFNDLKCFKVLIIGYIIIMGCKIFELFFKGVFFNCWNIVLSCWEGVVFVGVECFFVLEIVLFYCKEEEEIFIIGGVSLYKEVMYIV